MPDIRTVDPLPPTERLPFARAKLVLQLTEIENSVIAAVHEEHIDRAVLTRIVMRIGALSDRIDSFNK